MDKKVHHRILQTDPNAAEGRCQDLDRSGQWGGGQSGKVDSKGGVEKERVFQAEEMMYAKGPRQEHMSGESQEILVWP